jgi:preflagellin peptidase FlaK
MMDYWLIIRDLYVFIVLLIASYWDIVKREIEPSYWLVTGFIGLLLVVLSVATASLNVDLYGYILFSIIAIAIIGAFYYIGYMGGADLYAVIVIAVTVPKQVLGKGLIPAPFMTVVYGAIISVLIPIYFCLYNLASKNRRRAIKRTPKGYIMCFLGIPKRPKEYVNSKGFWFPLTTYESGMLVTRYSFQIEEEPEEHRQKIKALLDKNEIGENDFIWITPGIPFVVFILLGFILSVIIGDLPLQLLFGGVNGG